MTYSFNHVLQRNKFFAKEVLYNYQKWLQDYGELKL